MAAPCIHRRKASEAYRLDPVTGKQAEVTAWVCLWAEERIVGAPDWVTRLVGGGLMVDLDRDCVRCPGLTSPKLERVV